MMDKGIPQRTQRAAEGHGGNWEGEKNSSVTFG